MHIRIPWRTHAPTQTQAHAHTRARTKECCCCHTWPTPCSQSRNRSRPLDPTCLFSTLPLASECARFALVVTAHLPKHRRAFSWAWQSTILPRCACASVCQVCVKNVFLCFWECYPRFCFSTFRSLCLGASVATLDACVCHRQGNECSQKNQHKPSRGHTRGHTLRVNVPQLFHKKVSRVLWTGSGSSADLQERL